MVAMTMLFFSNGWHILGILTGACTIGGIVAIWDIIYMNKEEKPTKPIRKRSRRAEYFQSLTKEQQEIYLDNIDKNIKQHLKI